MRRYVLMMLCLLAMVVSGCAPAGGGVVAHEAALTPATPDVGPCTEEMLQKAADCRKAQMSSQEEEEEDCGCDE